MCTPIRFKVLSCIEELLLLVLTLLVDYTAGGLASGLAGGLALAATAVLNSLAYVFGFNSLNSLHLIGPP